MRRAMSAMERADVMADWACAMAVLAVASGEGRGGVGRKPGRVHWRCLCGVWWGGRGALGAGAVKCGAHGAIGWGVEGGRGAHGAGAMGCGAHGVLCRRNFLHDTVRKYVDRLSYDPRLCAVSVDSLDSRVVWW
jgi:hypothetical protein